MCVCAQRKLRFFCISPSLVLPHQFLLLPFFCCFFKLSARGFNVACALSALCEPNESKRAIQSCKIEHIQQESGQAEGFTSVELGMCVLYAQTSDRCQRTKRTTKGKSNKRSFWPNACPSTNPPWPHLSSSLLAAISTTHSLLLFPSSPFIFTSFLSSLSSFSSIAFASFFIFHFRRPCLCVRPAVYVYISLNTLWIQLLPSLPYSIPRSSSIYTFPSSQQLLYNLSRCSFFITQSPLTSRRSSLRYPCPNT